MWAKYNGILYDASIKSEEEVIIRSFKKSETEILSRKLRLPERSSLILYVL